MKNSKPIILYKTLLPGLNKLTIDADGSGFEWEDLYITLNVYNNKNQRTGPWDFHLLEKNRPVLPAYWVYLNGRKIGLWYFNRPSYTQIKARRFKGEACFWIKEEGQYEFRFEPYREFNIVWTRTDFGADPDDTLLNNRASLAASEQRGLQRLCDQERWEKLVSRWHGGDFPYRALLREAMDWARKPHEINEADQTYNSATLPILAADYRLTGRSESLGFAREVMEYYLSLPAWGNPREDGYGHNGDMGASNVIFELSVALNFLDGHLERPFVDRLLARLERQIDVFLEMGLLHRGYWGGSIIQDHGFCSFSWLATAVYALVGWTPKAKEWLRFCLPRMQRTFRALPTDGVVPLTSYHLLALYTDKVVLFRELHKQATGEDIYKFPAWRNVSRYAYASYAPEVGQFLHPSIRGDLTGFHGGHPFLDQMARDFSDAEAAWLARDYIRLTTDMALADAKWERSRLTMTLWSALLWEPVSLPEPTRLPRELVWFQDTGAITYRNEAEGLVLSARCGPPNGMTAQRHVTGPCDRITLSPNSGTFAIAKHGIPLIQNAEGGYKCRTELSNVVLVDNQGQLADYGPPMSCPDHPYGGEHIAEARLAPEGLGYVLMNLAPAYDAVLGLTLYTREFFFEKDGRIRLVDTIESKPPHRFIWLFHTFKSHPITQKDQNRFTIQSQQETLDLELAKSSAPLSGTIKDTLVVWGHRNENQDETFQHLEFETQDVVTSIRVEFVLRSPLDPSP